MKYFAKAKIKNRTYYGMYWTKTQSLEIMATSGTGIRLIGDVLYNQKVKPISKQELSKFVHAENYDSSLFLI